MKIVKSWRRSWNGKEKVRSWKTKIEKSKTPKESLRIQLAIFETELSKAKIKEFMKPKRLAELSLAAVKAEPAEKKEKIAQTEGTFEEKKPAMQKVVWIPNNRNRRERPSLRKKIVVGYYNCEDQVNKPLRIQLKLVTPTLESVRTGKLHKLIWKKWGLLGMKMGMTSLWDRWGTRYALTVVQWIDG